MTEPIVPPADPIEPDELDPVEPVEPEEDDDALAPEADPVPPQNETPEQLKARLAASEEARKKLYARLQREKNKGKQPPQAPAAPQPQAPAQPASLTADEIVVLTKGYSVEELDYAKKVAVLENCTPVQALESELFKGWKEKRDKDETSRKAQLGTSRGSRATVKKTFGTKGLSDEEHKQMFQEKIGK
jgi:hypothetical protein